MAVSKLFCQEGKLLFELTTSYHIMKEKLFEKFFANKKVTMPIDTVKYNPYLSEFPLKDCLFYNNSMLAKFGPLTLKECQGHFPKYPSIPVAILMHALNQAAARYLANVLNIKYVKYSVSHAKMNAENLAFAGDLVLIAVDYIGPVENQHKFACKAFGETDIEYGSLQLTLENQSLKGN